MIKIDKNKISIKFNSAFYSLDSLRRTRKSYSNICNTAIHKQENYLFVEIIPLDATPDLNQLALEFSNYALALQK
jgi:hypothetical protein